MNAYWIQTFLDNILFSNLFEHVYLNKIYDFLQKSYYISIVFAKRSEFDIVRGQTLTSLSEIL